MQTLIETVEHKHHNISQENSKKNRIEFQVFFNDQTANDFNTLFASLPVQHERKYFAAGVPGSFYGRLFPSSSIHIAYCFSSLHWLSELPVDLVDRNSPAYNSGRIHYTGASDAVVEAYAGQFEKDMEVFLTARAEEIVGGGMIVILMPGVPYGGVTHDVGIALIFLGSILMDMVNEGTSAFAVTCVARNHEGRCLAWKVKRCNGKLQPVEGETLAAVLLAKANGWADIRLEGDCLPVIKALCAGSGETLHYGAIIEECLFLSQKFSSCKFSFVKREGNHLAHNLAHLPCSDILEGVELPVNMASSTQ